jgi:hypothetical protein
MPSIPSQLAPRAHSQSTSLGRGASPCSPPRRTQPLCFHRQPSSSFCSEAPVLSGLVRAAARLRVMRAPSARDGRTDSGTGRRSGEEDTGAGTAGHGSTPCVCELSLSLCVPRCVCVFVTVRPSRRCRPLCPTPCLSWAGSLDFDERARSCPPRARGSRDATRKAPPAPCCSFPQSGGGQMRDANRLRTCCCLYGSIVSGLNGQQGDANTGAAATAPQSANKQSKKSRTRDS